MCCEKIPKKYVRGKSDVRQIKNKMLQKILIPKGIMSAVSV